MSELKRGVSVCIPVFNGERYITQTIESVAKQIGSIRELIIVDNVSTDRTLDIVEETIQRFNIREKVRIEKNPKHIPVASNWNRCIELAETEFIKLLCADDLLYPDSIEKQVRLLQAADADVVLVCSRRDIISAQGQLIVRERGGFLMEGAVSGDFIIRKLVRSGTNPIGEPVSVLFSKQRALEVGGFSAHFPYLTDVDLWTRMIQGRRLILSLDCVGAFRVSPGSWSAAIGLRQGAQVTRFFKALKAKTVAITWGDLLLGSLKAYLFSLMRGLLYLSMRS